MKKITFIPRHIAANWIPTVKSVLVSIYDKEDGPLLVSDQWADVLSLQFDDIDETGGNADLVLFSEEQAQEILEFVFNYANPEEQCEELVVHCGLGQSRSAAVALFFAEVCEVPCFKEQLKVTASSYQLYNKKIYSTLRTALYGAPGQAFMLPPESAQN